MNTRITYRYCDSHNFTSTEYVVVSGIVTTEQLVPYCFTSRTYGSNLFIPFDVGLLEVQFAGPSGPRAIVRSKPDHPWHSLIGCAMTQDEPTIPKSAEQLSTLHELAFQKGAAFGIAIFLI